ncbi:MAG: hypothetical protein MI922_25775, partial [Bacteroidales bacterium]|nr:hypothetical protein [Bacteroidales bacterium]
MKTKRFFKVVTLAATLGLVGSWQLNAQQVPSHMDRFRQLYEDIHNPANGYFSPEGAPYHSVETMIVEAPDQGHESTSELYSYWIWLEAMYGKVEGDWEPLKKAWKTMENQIIPTADDQPTNNYYTPHKPSNVAPEFPEPSFYPA